MKEIYERIGRAGIVPVIKLDDAAAAEPLGEALLQGNIPVAEITFRSEGADESICRMKAAVPELLVGAGTVLTIEQADRAIKAGAEFIVAPGLNKEVVQFVQDKGIPMIPGVMTPSEIEAAIHMGIYIMKFFPAEPAGGLAMIQALAAPYRHVKFIPTGGINASNLERYLQSDKIFACGGSWMVTAEMIKRKAFADISKLCRQAVAIRERIRG